MKMNILAWIVFGLIAGSIANLLDPQPSSGGALTSIILGIMGAVIGGMVANLLFGASITGFNINSFVIAILGSLLLLFVERAVSER